MKQVAFEKGSKSRAELFLPPLRFIVADDWIDKLGPKAFAAWLKFHSWVDRQDAGRKYDKIPYTLEDVANKLGMSKSTLYRTVIRPLWEYYLIDLVEYEESQRKTQKPMNIIVYESPMNQHETEIKPLEKLRDWKKDYASAPQLFGRKGGRPKKNSPDDPDRFKNETVGGDVLNRFKNKTVYRFKNKTVTVSKIKPNNYSNKLLILSNKPNNVSNNHHHQKPDDDDASAAVDPWEIDEQYNTYNSMYVKVGADPIFDHPTHYPKFKAVVERIGFDALCQATEKYLQQEGKHAQIVYFLSGKYNEYLPKKQEKQAKENTHKQDKPSKQDKHQLPETLRAQMADQQANQTSQAMDLEQQALIREKLRLMHEQSKNVSATP